MFSATKRFGVALAFVALALLLSAGATHGQQSGAAPMSHPPMKRRPARNGLQQVSDLEQLTNTVLLQQSMNAAQQITLSISQQQLNFAQPPPASVLQQQLTAVQQQLNAVEQQRQQVQSLRQQLSAAQFQPLGPLATLQLELLQQQAAVAAQQDDLQEQQLTAMQQQVVNALRQPGQ
jgi:hypothetical protein